MGKTSVAIQCHLEFKFTPSGSRVLEAKVPPQLSRMIGNTQQGLALHSWKRITLTMTDRYCYYPFSRGGSKGKYLNRSHTQLGAERSFNCRWTQKTVLLISPFFNIQPTRHHLKVGSTWSSPTGFSPFRVKHQTFLVDFCVVTEVIFSVGWWRKADNESHDCYS